GAKRAADEALYLVRPARRAAAPSLSLRALLSGARQHRILGRQPPLPRVASEWRHALVERRRADDARAPHLYERGALGVGHEAGRDAHLAQLVGAPSVRALLRRLASGFEAHPAPRPP